jgi:hypothetical protein
VSHGCPADVVHYVTQFGLVRRTSTNSMFNQMLAIHSPMLWVFGHYHTSFKFKYANTNFACLDELEVASIDEIMSSDFFDVEKFK